MTKNLKEESYMSFTIMGRHEFSQAWLFLYHQNGSFRSRACRRFVSFFVKGKRPVYYWKLVQFEEKTQYRQKEVLITREFGVVEKMERLGRKNKKKEDKMGHKMKYPIMASKWNKDYVAKMEKLDTIAFTQLNEGRLVTRQLIRVIMVNF